MKEFEVKGTKLFLVSGDITRQAVDAIVNAANSSLLGGGGVDGAIHRAGGPQILAECKKIREKEGGCPPGHAVVTTAGKLPAKYVIHTVGPVWRGGKRSEAETLASCYRESLRLAAEKKCRTLAFPSISTGAYGYPIERAARVALATVIEELKKLSLDEVRFVLFSAADLAAYEEALEKVTRDAKDAR